MKWQPKQLRNKDSFGRSVALSADFIVSGAHRTKVAGVGLVGAVYVTEISTSRVWALHAPDGKYNDQFGSDVAVHGNRIAVGALGVDKAKGAVYTFIFDGTDWKPEEG